MLTAPGSMHKGHGVLVRVCCALSMGLCAYGPSPLAAQTGPSDGFNTAHLDRRVDACTDFYQFACGSWIADNPLPADRARYSRLNELADRNARIVREILENAA